MCLVEWQKRATYLKVCSQASVFKLSNSLTLCGLTFCLHHLSTWFLKCSLSTTMVREAKNLPTSVEILLSTNLFKWHASSYANSLGKCGIVLYRRVIKTYICVNDSLPNNSSIPITTPQFETAYAMLARRCLSTACRLLSVLHSNSSSLFIAGFFVSCTQMKSSIIIYINSLSLMENIIINTTNNVAAVRNWHLLIFLQSGVKQGNEE